MNESKISVRYAKALFMSASEKGVVDRVREDMEYILLLSSLDDVKELLDSPVIANSLKRETLRLLVKDRVHELTFSLVNLTINNNRDSYLAGIARSYIDRADRFNGITRAKLTTAVGLDSAMLDRIKKLLESGMKTKVNFQEVTDPGVIGGFLLQVEDNFIDGSVRTQLRKIKKELKKE